MEYNKWGLQPSIEDNPSLVGVNRFADRPLQYHHDVWYDSC